MEDKKIVLPENESPNQDTPVRQRQNAAPRFESEEDIDRYLTEMQMREAKAERARDEERIRRQTAARSLADVGSVFTDMIKASQGAVVSPRTVDEHYNRLSDQQKAVVDGYRARMDLLYKQQKERARQKEEDARRARELEEARQHDKDMLNLKLKAGAEADAARREFEAGQADLNRKNQYAIYASRNSRRPEDEYYINFGDVGGRHVEKDYLNNTKEGSNVFAAIYNYLHDIAKFIPDYKDKDGNIITVHDQRTRDEFVREYLNAAMQDPTHKAAIYKIVFGKDMPGYATAPATPGPVSEESIYVHPSNYVFYPIQHATPTAQNGQVGAGNSRGRGRK